MRHCAVEILKTRDLLADENVSCRSAILSRGCCYWCCILITLTAASAVTIWAVITSRG